jgi:hypothetical protein
VKTWFEEDGETLINLNLVTHIKMVEVGTNEKTNETEYEVIAFSGDLEFTIETNKDWNDAHATLGVICSYLESPEDTLPDDFVPIDPK